ncbi:hypothetical protein Taro_014902 [Colocasia esculenta]|uniref:Uncharacterized protein n=1 Tax=Colocasia esculenta TaxID=4460 RepID=A0A843UK02_COLES|nr:hypothetical protein [Colocasia esculenta]
MVPDPLLLLALAVRCVVGNIPSSTPHVVESTAVGSKPPCLPLPSLAEVGPTTSAPLPLTVGLYNREMEERYINDSQHPELDHDIWIAAYEAPKKARWEALAAARLCRRHLGLKGELPRCRPLGGATTGEVPLLG